MTEEDIVGENRSCVHRCMGKFEPRTVLKLVLGNDFQKNWNTVQRDLKFVRNNSGTAALGSRSSRLSEQIEVIHDSTCTAPVLTLLVRSLWLEHALY